MDYQRYFRSDAGLLQYSRFGFASACTLVGLLTVPVFAQAQEPVAAPVQLAQQYPPQQKRRTLFDMLFSDVL